MHFTIIPPRLTGFTGSVAIGGPGSCPHGTYTINYTALNYTFGDEDEASLAFDTDLICDMTTAFWNASEESVADAMNDPIVGLKLIAAIREGECE